MLAGTKLLKKRQPKKIKRTRTTTLTDYGVILSHPAPKPNNQRKRILSPTRRQNPHPVGLEYQGALQPHGPSYAIWKPDVRSIMNRYSEMVSYLDMSNFTCGPYSALSPWETERAGPPEIQYSLTSTSRASFQDPYFYPGLAGVGKRKQITRYDNTPDDGLVIGLVPYSLPKIVKGRNLINIQQGGETTAEKDDDDEEEEDDVDNIPLNNTAYRTIWRYTGLRPIIGCQN